jgi:hypothetical protein
VSAQASGPGPLISEAAPEFVSLVDWRTDENKTWCSVLRCGFVANALPWNAGGGLDRIIAGTKQQTTHRTELPTNLHKCTGSDKEIAEIVVCYPTLPYDTVGNLG